MYHACAVCSRSILRNVRRSDGKHSAPCGTICLPLKMLKCRVDMHFFQDFCSRSISGFQVIVLEEGINTLVAPFELLSVILKMLNSACDMHKSFTFSKNSKTRRKSTLLFKSLLKASLHPDVSAEMHFDSLHD